jgi:uncharacterized protein (DUF1697 family)
MIGHRPVKMEAVHHVFEHLGYQHVKTLGASGNVLFETSEVDQTALLKHIEENLETAFGYAIRVLIRTLAEIQTLVESDPFKSTPVTPHTKLLITFLSARPNNQIEVPYTSPGNDFKIVRVFPHEICSVALLSPTRQRTGLLSFLEKAFGREITTRNWSTITRIVKS